MGLYKVTIIRKTGEILHRYRYAKCFQSAIDQALDGFDGITIEAVESGDLEIRFVKIGEKK